MTSRLATPLDVAVQPEFYFDASQTATYTLDGNGKLQSRRDVSGKGVVALADPGREPTPLPAGASAFPLPALSYDESIEFAPVRITGRKLTAFLVVQILRNNHLYDRIMSYGKPGQTDYQNTGSFDLERAQWPGIQLMRVSGYGDWFDPSPTEPLLLEVVYDGEKGTLFLNGRFVQDNYSDWDFDIEITSFGGAIMRDSWCRSIQAAQLVYADALSAADRAVVRGALAWQWDGGTAGPLVAQLPADDPYKLAPPTIATGAPAATPRRRRPLLVTG